MTDLIIIAVILIIVGLSSAYIIKAKRRGVKCIGCDCGCSDKKTQDSGCCCGCTCQTEDI